MIIIKYVENFLKRELLEKQELENKGPQASFLSLGLIADKDFYQSIQELSTLGVDFLNSNSDLDFLLDHLFETKGISFAYMNLQQAKRMAKTIGFEEQINLGYSDNNFYKLFLDLPQEGEKIILTPYDTTLPFSILVSFNREEKLKSTMSNFQKFCIFRLMSKLFDINRETVETFERGTNCAQFFANQVLNDKRTFVYDMVNNPIITPLVILKNRNTGEIRKYDFLRLALDGMGVPNVYDFYLLEFLGDEDADMKSNLSKFLKRMFSTYKQAGL